MKKTLFMISALAMLASCGGNKAQEEAAQTEAAAEVQADSIGLDGKWRLDNYIVDCASTCFDSESPYGLTFIEAENAFGISTDCNTIGGAFGVTNDTIRFSNALMTEMACEEETVQNDMLRLVNDPDAYGLWEGDTLVYTAPSVGKAVFVRAK